MCVFDDQEKLDDPDLIRPGAGEGSETWHEVEGARGSPNKRPRLGASMPRRRVDGLNTSSVLKRGLTYSS